MLQEVYVIGEYSSEIGEDIQELKKAYGGTLEDFLNYFKEDWLEWVIVIIASTPTTLIMNGSV